jgi:thioredoxin-like negative regulator of GroEL
MKHILYFYKNGCGPCNEVKSAIEKFTLTNEITRINIDETETIADKLNVMYTPSIIVIDEQSKKIDRYEGTKQVKKYINENTL